MSLKSWFVRTRDAAVVAQVQRAKLPVFGESETKRWRIIFSGRVQKVGFRLEVSELAGRLGLTGFCRNLENGDVLAELQGSEEKIRYLVAFMESLKRIRIRKKIVEELPPDLTETGFFQQ